MGLTNNKIYSKFINEMKKNFHTFIFKKSNPKGYVKYFLKNSIRHDGRSLTQCRDLEAEIDCFTQCSGSSMIKTVGTLVVCGCHLKPTLMKKNSTKPSLITFDISVLPFDYTNLQYKNNFWLTELFQEWFIRNKLLDTRLVPEKNKKVIWHIYVDLICLSLDGNLIDTCLYAVTLALKKIRISNTNILNNIVKVKNQIISFIFLRNIFSLTVCFFEGKILVDPTLLEEEHSNGIATFVIDELQDIKYIMKNGRHVLKNIKSLKKLTQQRGKQLINVLRNF